jgi:hypothetical protein
MAVAYYIFVLGLLIICLYMIDMHLEPLPPVPIEPFQEQQNIVICLLCVCPNTRVLDFAAKYAKTHPVVVILDDPTCSIPPNSEDLTFVRITDEECVKTGYINSNTAILKRPSAWDKAIYYFCVKDRSPEHIWFIEEDVFVPRPALFKELDQRYPATDFIMKQHVKDTDDPSFEFWSNGDGKMERPFYRSLVCTTRISRRLLDRVKDLHDQHNTLVFIEIVFSTLAQKHGYSMEMPHELQSIIFRHTWTEDTVNKDQFFHPVKDTALHDSYRARLGTHTE